MENIPLFKVFMSSDIMDTLGDVLNSGYVGQGPKVEEFEQLLQGYFGNPYVNTVNSGTSGLHLALHMIKSEAVYPRTEILTTPLTCTATNFPIRAHNLDIKWVDIDTENCNIDMTDLRRKISPRTLAIMVVHWGGAPCNLNELKNIQDECESLYGFRPYIIEDCAHAFGAKYKGKLLGNHGNFCMFSLQAIKHLTTADGGLLLTPDYNLHRRAKLLRWFGLDRERSPDMRCEQNVKEWGYKFHMNDIAATIGIHNFKTINERVKKHIDNGLFFDKVLDGVNGVKVLHQLPGAESSYWIYTIRVKNRDGFVRKMAENNISVSKVHDRNDKHECLKEYVIPLPNTTEVCSDMICIPCGWWVGEEERERIVDCIKGGW